MSASVSSVPVPNPAGVRITTGTITFDSSYPTGGEVLTVAQWGGGSNGIPGRKPDFVVFNTTAALDAADTDAALVPGYNKATGAVALFGDTATEGTGLDEIDSTVDASTVTVQYLAIWINFDPAGVTTV